MQARKPGRIPMNPEYKRTKISLSMSRETRMMLDHMAYTSGKSRSSIIEKMVEKEYAKFSKKNGTYTQIKGQMHLTEFDVD